MALSTLAALLLGAISITTPVSADFVGYEFNDADNALWERFDVRLTNTASDETRLALCPTESKLLVAEPLGGSRTRTLSMTGSAVALDDSAWDFDCAERILPAGESVTVSLFFRSWVNSWNRRWGRSVVLSTSLGDFFVREGEVTLLEASTEG